MQIAVCDDSKFILCEIERQLQAISFVENVFTFSNYDTFLFSVDEGKRYDAILMDIEWNRESNGMDIAEELYKLCPESKVIFVTGHPDRFMQQIFLHKANLSGFLSKPVDFELLRANLQKVFTAMSYSEQPALVLRRRGSPVSVPLREIFFIESKGHTVEVHAANNTIAAYERLDSVLQMLPIGFYQCHKSYIVNMSQIRRFQSTDILLKNGETVPVSRARYSETKEAYFSFIGKTF